MEMHRAKVASRPIYTFADAARGGTAPGPPGADSIIYKRMPNSSHNKIMVRAMNYAATHGLHKMTLKGKGWSSKGQSVKTRPMTRQTATASKGREELRRPKSIKTRLHDLDQDLDFEEKPPMLSNTEEARPISRHKTPPKAVGLELPPWPVTPPDSNKLEMTWSHTKEIDFDDTVSSNIPLKAFRPKVQAWQKEQRVSSAGYNDSRSIKTPKIQTPRNSLRNSRIEIITSPSKRAISANRINKSKTPKSPAIRSAKISTAHLKSSLDPEFLEMFSNF